MENKLFTGLSRDFWGNFVYVFFSPIRNDPKKKKHINKFLAPTQSRDNPANLFMFMCVFSCPHAVLKTLRVVDQYGDSTTRPEMITQTIRKHFFCVTDLCVIGKFIPRPLMCVIGAFAKVPYEGAELHKIIPGQKALCNGCPV